MHIDILADVICPWCFIGKRRLERALALRPDLSATLSWRAFELNPDLPIEGIPREIYLSAKFGSAIKAERLYAAITAAGRAEGIEFAFERIRHTPNTLRAHRLIRLAGDKGCAEPVVEPCSKPTLSRDWTSGLPRPWASSRDVPASAGRRLWNI